MKYIIPIIIGIIAIIILFGAILVGKYNAMITAEQAINQQQAQVEVELQRRYDLIPNLVESVKGVLTQEQTIFTEIADARTKYGSAETGTTEKVEASNELEGAISRLLVIIENYPDLQSDETVQSLMDELAGTENRIAVERERYNEKVTDYNIMVKTFPNNLIANFFGFTEKPLFDAVESADEAPEVDLTLD